MKEAQQNLGFHFGSNALNYRVVGYIEVANTWRYKGPTVVPFAVINQYGCQENSFQITPETVNELFLAAKQAKLKPLALLASLQYGENDTVTAYASFPRAAEGFKLAKRMHPNPATPVFAVVNKYGVCLSSSPADFAVLVQAPVPTQLKFRTGTYRDVFNVAVMMSPGSAAGFFCITPETTKQVFDLCKAHALDPTNLMTFVRVEDSYELKECNRFIVAHEDGLINDGDPIYIAGFDVRELLRSTKAEEPVEPPASAASVNSDAPAVFRGRTKVTSITDTSPGPKILNRQEIQARQST